ncbi:MAG: hypothetical protein GY861_06875 [bacterium]|nr:hypothetical protein [bacterium]
MNKEQKRTIAVFLVVFALLFISIKLGPVIIGAASQVLMSVYTTDPFNEPPVLEPVGNQTAAFNVTFTLQLNASDPDGHTVYYGDDASFFDVDVNTGLISFAHLIEAGGTYVINITACDYALCDHEMINFTLLERPEYCGDGSCNNGETCETCPGDCGVCPVPPEPEPGAGGAGGGAAESGSVPISGILRGSYFCLENWKCSEWSECTMEGIQTRVCEDINDCDTEKQKPTEKRACKYVPTCFDGVQNGDETGVDCGGSCPSCEIPASCFDGIQNGDETGVDCGGSCPECGIEEVAKPPFIEMPIVVVLKRYIPWLLLIIMALIILLSVGGDRVYVKHISKKPTEDYREKMNKYRKMRNRLYKLVINMAVMTLIAAVYLYAFSDCGECITRYALIPLMIALVVPFIVSFVMKKLEYREYMKKKRERLLEQTHKKQLYQLIKLEDEVLLEIEKRAVSRITRCTEKDGFASVPLLKEKFEPLKEKIDELRKLREQDMKKILEVDEDVLNRINQLSANETLKEISEEYTELKVILDELNTIRKRSARREDVSESVMSLIDDIDAITADNHIMSVINSFPQLVRAYNRLVDIYDYYKNKQQYIDADKERIRNTEKVFCKGLQPLIMDTKVLDLVQKEDRFVRIYNSLIDLMDHYKKKQMLFVRD